MSKKTTKKTTQKKTDIQRRELAPEEQRRMDKYNERAKKQPVRFKDVELDSGQRTVALQDTDDNMRIVKLTEAMGTPDCDLQSYLLHQVMYTFNVVRSYLLERGCKSLGKVELYVFWLHNRQSDLMNGGNLDFLLRFR